MKVNFDKPFMDCYGSPVNSDKDRTIAKSLCTIIFNLSTLGGIPIPAEKKYSLHKLCMKIAQSPEEVEITTEEGTLIKEVAAEAYSCGGYGQIVDIIENN